MGQVVRWFGGCFWPPARFHCHGNRDPTKDGGSQGCEVEAAPETWESYEHPSSLEKDERAEGQRMQTFLFCLLLV